jgi:hypothetical protein
MNSSAAAKICLFGGRIKAKDKGPEGLCAGAPRLGSGCGRGEQLREPDHDQ